MRLLERADGIATSLVRWHLHVFLEQTFRLA